MSRGTLCVCDEKGQEGTVSLKRYPDTNRLPDNLTRDRLPECGAFPHGCSTCYNCCVSQHLRLP